MASSSASAFHIPWGSSARMSMDALTIRTPDGKEKDCGQRWEHAPFSTTKAARARGRKSTRSRCVPTRSRGEIRGQHSVCERDGRVESGYFTVSDELNELDGGKGFTGR